MNIQQRREKFQLRVIHKLLAKPYIDTFPTYEEAEAYGKQLEALLANNVVPHELLEGHGAGISPRMVDVIDQYTVAAPVTASDSELLPVIAKEVVGLRVSGLTYKWVEAWVRKLKVERNLAPGTIRKRVESLARVVDWHLLSTTQNKLGNPLRMLPTGYSGYSEHDVKLLPEGKQAKRDAQRDRRLPSDEETLVRAALAGQKREDRERALAVDPAFILLFDMILDTGLRLQEAYTLRVNQLDFKQGVIRVEGSKGHRGQIKPRVVPLKRGIRERLRTWCDGRVGLVYPFWDGTKEDMKKASKRLTVRFGKLFEYAGLKDITEHDLRHEACCRWFELRGADGRWLFSDVEICKIMGWSDYSMILRYASLRGEDLASRLE